MRTKRIDQQDPLAGLILMLNCTSEPSSNKAFEVGLVFAWGQNQRRLSIRDFYRISIGTVWVQRQTSSCMKHSASHFEGFLVKQPGSYRNRYHNLQTSKAPIESQAKAPAYSQVPRQIRWVVQRVAHGLISSVRGDSVAACDGCLLGRELENG